MIDITNYYQIAHNNVDKLAMKQQILINNPINTLSSNWINKIHDMNIWMPITIFEKFLQILCVLCMSFDC